jgi:hypothetical protein
MAPVPLTSNFMPLQPCNAKSDSSASRYSTWWAMRRGDLSTDKVRRKSCLKERSVSPRTHLFGDALTRITSLSGCVETYKERACPRWRQSIQRIVCCQNNFSRAVALLQPTESHHECHRPVTFAHPFVTVRSGPLVRIHAAQAPRLAHA